MKMSDVITEAGVEQMSESVDTITMQVEVPIPNATQTQRAMYEDMAMLFEDRFDTFVRKNLDYGSSFLTAGRVDMLLSEDGPFDHPHDANLFKLFTRIQDKNQRFYQQQFCGGENLVHESAAETAGDAMVYWAMIELLCQSPNAYYDD